MSLAARVVVCGASAVLAGCSSCASPSSPPSMAPDAADARLDSSAEAASPDASKDALSEPAEDTLIDVGKLDTGPEGGLKEGEWVTSPYSQFLQCPVEQAADLAAVTPATWLPCPGGLTGCRLLDTSYLPGAYKMILAGVAPVGRGPSPAFGVERGWAAKIPSPTIYSATSGAALASWRYSPDDHCSLLVQALFASEVALVIGPSEQVTAQNDIGQRVVLGSVASVLSATAESYDLLQSMVGYNGASEISVSPQLIAVALAPAGRMLVASRPNGKLVEVPIPGGYGNGIFGRPVIVGPDVVADYIGVNGSSIAVRHSDNTVENLRVDPERVVNLLGGDDSWLVWQEGYNGTLTTGFANVELWAAKPSGSPASFSPAKVTDLPFAESESHMGSEFAYGEGWHLFGFGLALAQIRITRISDGKHVDVSPPEGYLFAKPLGVAAGDAWLLLRNAVGSAYPVTIERLSLKELETQLQ